MQGDLERQSEVRRCGGHPLRRPERRPRHARNVKSHLRHHGQGAGAASRIDHRRAVFRRQSWLRGRTCVAGGGARRPAGLGQDGDGITIDAEHREITLHISAAEFKRRRKSWAPPKPYARRGALAKYARQVSSASLGAVTDLEQGTSRSKNHGRRLVQVISRSKSRLQFRRDMCQALYSPKGMKGRHCDVACLRDVVGDAHRGARGAASDSIQG